MENEKIEFQFEEIRKEDIPEPKTKKSMVYMNTLRRFLNSRFVCIQIVEKTTPTKWREMITKANFPITVVQRGHVVYLTKTE